MRRLTVLPCPESWERMREDGDGRFCERCQLRVADVARLDADGVQELIEAAGRGRICASFELEDGRARTRLAVSSRRRGMTTTDSTEPSPCMPIE